MATSQSTIRVGIVGAGPRGVVALERLCANAPLLAPGVTVEVHLIDPCPPGGGRVWQQDQDRSLLMNTVASDVTVFTDDSVPCEGPIVPGPTQYQWARMVTEGLIDDVSAADRAECAGMLPWSYGSRALNGGYLRWALGHIIRTAPAEISVRTHATRAVALDDASGGRQVLRLEEREDGAETELLLDAVVLAQGHFDVAPTESQQRLRHFAAEHGLVYQEPVSPAEADLSDFPAGEPVVLRGLGLSFFDYVTLLTQGRGGRLHRDEAGRLRYEPSGKEPLLYAGSGRGVPYTARAEIHLEVVPRYQPRFLTAEVITELRHGAGRGETDFMNHLWPYVAKEVGFVYYRALLGRAPEAEREAFLAEYSRLDWDSAAMLELIERHVPDPAERWDWARVDRPGLGRRFADRAEYDAWVAGRLRWDLEQSAAGPATSPFKATAAIMRDLRDEIRQVISHQGLRGASYREHVDRWFSGLNNYVASGPPVARIEELEALVAAGVVRMVGPRMRVECDAERGRFLVSSPEVDEAPLEVTALLEAHLALTDVRRATDPLLRHLLTTGGCRPHTIPDTEGPGYETGGVDVAETSFRLIDVAGTPHRGRFSYGPPVESVQWVTAIGARPHVGSRTLLQGDAITRGCLRTGVENLGQRRMAVA
ncbi:FAD/NAD(P)-binding protein [Streptomyces sp. LX-29]|uniref:FAD/NAD(P)-binding protein n=1 Tax=Streptomyces sp. LX-29 TaxID=2900152 RepID=UPI00240E7383|nr:FAD/NAD(P)-binding protein [Streptomyces sp. LX-29]WFB09669.1 FAD/NAD(P)-binding protein [Streptomyces sp. LX-29]